MQKKSQRLIIIKDLTIRIGTRCFVKNLSMTLNMGDKLVIIGEEGNGKSTLIKIIAGQNLNRCFNFNGDTQRLGKTAYLPQNFLELDFAGTVWEFLARDSGWQDNNWNIFNKWNELNKLAKELEIKDILDNNPDYEDLSGGEKTRLFLLKNLYSKPDILLLDEPTNNLDQKGINIVSEIVKKFSGAVVFVSHDLSFIRRTANRIIHLEQISGRGDGRCYIENIGIDEYLESNAKKYRQEEKFYLMQNRKKRKALKILVEIKNRVRQQQENIKNCNVRRLLNKKMRNILATEKNISRKFLAKKPQKEINHGLDLDHKQKNKKSWEIDIPRIEFDNKLLFTEKKLWFGDGKKIVVMGDNGFGKSVLLEYIYQKLKQKKVMVGYLPQEFVKLFIGAEKKLLDIEWQDDRYKNLGNIGLTGQEIAGEWMGLSEGQKTKLWLKKIFGEENDILILDEPFRHLSISASQSLQDAIINDSRTVIVVTHDKLIADKLGDIVWKIFNKHIEVKWL